MAETVIKKCTCSDAYQDEKYGPGNRVMNVGGTKDKPKRTCTKCGKQS